MERKRLAGVRGVENYRTRQEEYKMAYVISDECTMCGACVETCPSEAIKEGDPKYVIDPELCVDCASCVDACPVDAISEE